MHPIIEKKRTEIIDLCDQYGVSRLEIFGSAARMTDFVDGTSDFDFLVVFENQDRRPSLTEYFGFKEALSALLGHPVDLVSERAIRNPYLIKYINEDRQPVYAA